MKASCGHCEIRRAADGTVVMVVSFACGEHGHLGLELGHDPNADFDADELGLDPEEEFE